MLIHFATDHAGFELKQALVAYVRDELGHEVKDWGAKALEAGDDYPDVVAPAAAAVAAAAGAGREERGIIIGGSGQGEAMCANRYQGVRAAVYYGGAIEIVKLSREHNDANVLSLGARFVSSDDAKQVVGLWLDVPFSGDRRHVRRNTKLDQLL